MQKWVGEVFKPKASVDVAKVWGAVICELRQ